MFVAFFVIAWRDEQPISQSWGIAFIEGSSFTGGYQNMMKKQQIGLRRQKKVWLSAGEVKFQGCRPTGGNCQEFGKYYWSNL